MSQTLRYYLHGLFLTLGFCAASAFATPAGKILASAGDVRATRGEQILPLPSGTTVENGDIVQCGENSNAQLRMLDGALIALRPNSSLRVDDYRFAAEGKKTDNRAAVSLLRGGLRTVSGVIGKISPESYKVATPTANIGIRGTHYNIRHCEAGACPGENGQTADEGTYGQVIDGAIAVENDAGTQEVRKGQIFYVRNKQTAPRLLVAPPTLLGDNLPGKGRGDRASGDGGADSEVLARSGLNAESRLNQPESPRLDQPFRPVENLTPGGTPAVIPPTRSCNPNNYLTAGCP